MKFGREFRSLLLAPAAKSARAIRCITHDRMFSESMDTNFHESAHVNCKWERVER